MHVNDGRRSGRINWRERWEVRGIVILNHYLRGWRGSCSRQSRSDLRRIECGRAPRLHIVECVERSRPTESLKGEVGVDPRVHGEDKHWEINQESQVFGSDETTATLGHMRAKAVERNGQVRDMKNVANKNALPIEGEDSGTSTKKRNIRIVPHSNRQAGDGLVTDKGGFVWHHIVGGASISNRETTSCSRKDHSREGE